MDGRSALANCGAVLTNAGGAAEGGSVVYSDGRIVGVENGAPPDECDVIDVGGRVVTPGLVDAHTHAVFAGSRAVEYEARVSGATYQEITQAGGGIMSTVRAVRASSLEALVERSKRQLHWMLRCGTTTAEVKSGYGLTTEDELKMLLAVRSLKELTPVSLVPTFMGAHTVPSEFRGRKEQYMNLVLGETLPQVAAQGLAEAVDMFVEEGHFDHSDARRLATVAREHGMRLRLHVDQFSTGGAQLAADLGAATADHLEQTGAEGIDAMASAGVIPVLLPASVLCLGLTKYPDARAMLDRGLPVALATDFNPGSSPTPSLPFVMSLACTQMGMTPVEALRACTVNAAKAIGRTDAGVLASGAPADIVVWDTDDLREVPYFVGAPLAWAVFKNGVRVV